MSEEALEAGAPETVETVDAAPVEAAPAADAPVEVESSLTAEPDPQPEAEAPVSFPSADEFGWDTWDGKHESFPDQLQPWGERIGSFYSKKMEDLNNDLDRNKEIYEALMGGKEDPRLAKYQTEVSEWETKYNTREQEFNALQTEYTDYQKIVNQAIEDEANEYANAFRDANPQLFENGELKERFTALLEDGWSVESAAVASRLPKSALAVAREAKSNGVPETYALRLAEGAKSRPAKPRPGAQITAGATTPARPPEQAPLAPDTGAMSLRDFRTLAARRALTPKKTRRA